MAKPKPPPECVQLVAVFSRDTTAIDWACSKIANAWGAIALQSPRFDHSETRYYEREMGTDLKKQFFVMDGFYDPSRLARNKLQSNEWEQEFAERTNSDVQRPVNIDPGYLTLTKLVLASAKDRAHRIYLHSGIYAEECLFFLDGRWQARAWTYPDYRRTDFQHFFGEVRDMLRQIIADSNRSEP
jgi:hypothetical protein